jgi:hypothetical protein
MTTLRAWAIFSSPKPEGDPMKLLLLLTSMLLLSACRDSWKEAEKFEVLLENETGQSHSLVKFSTKVPGYRVYKNEVTGEYSAYNLENYNRKKVETYEAYLAVAGESAVVHNLEVKNEWVEEGHYYEESNSYTVCDSNNENCYTQTDTWTTDEWIDTSHYEDFYYGGGFRFSNVSVRSRDLETVAALQEEAAVKMMSVVLSSQYSLSSIRAEELATLSYRYKKLENARELTASEKDMFAMKALGVSMTEVERSMKGDDKTYQNLLETAAQVNRTTPEQIGQFFQDYML